MESKQLTVYKASAGSGKTFTLAVEFISLLIENPMSYRNILAVTFTNKATEEMKLRILSQLYGIWHELDSSENYLNSVSKSVGLSRRQIVERAGIALSNLIHDYSYFNVETIDTFFQSVMRNLARELDLTANLRVSLNDNQVEEQAVDRLIERLSQHDVMLTWIIDFIQKNMDEDKSWNVIGQIKKFGKTIFRDFYKSESEALKEKVDDEHFFPSYVKQLEGIRRSAKEHMNGYAERFFRIISAHDLSPDSFAGKKKGIGSYFRKLRESDFSDKTCYNTVVEKSLADANNWASKTSKERAAIVSLAESELMELLRSAENDRPRQWQLYLTADVTLRHLSQVRLLSSIEHEVNVINDETNRFLLSNTQQILHELIEDSDSPFIYEKTGTQLDHIMIDEFQDTSTVQWQNFKVLLEDTMSRSSKTEQQIGHGMTRALINNLIVGDVKQSIYRWRSGDWRLLNGIGHQFVNPEERLRIRTLDTNWRSYANVIRFNNAFFEEAAKHEYEAEKNINAAEAETVVTAYEDVCQSIPDSKPSEGLVRIVLLPRNGYDEEVMQRMGEQVDELLDEEYPLNSIAILVRSNRHIPLIADYFMRTRPDLKLVSDEAFRLDNSQAVLTIVSAMRYLLNEEDKLSQANVEKVFRRVSGSALGDLLDTERDRLLSLPITDMTECIIRLLSLEKLSHQSAYICTFMDQLNMYAQEFGTDVKGFIDTWDDALHEKTIQSDVVDGIRLISIHKSKGLEFTNVIIPFCDWKLEMGNTLWCKPGTPPFDQLPIVPIDYSSKLTDTIYKDDYANEHLQNCVDNLNLLYVAFTRAVKNLFVIGKRDASGTRSALLQDVINTIHLEGILLSGEDDKTQPLVFEYGSLSKPKEEKKEAKEERNVFLLPMETIAVDFRSFDSAVDFKQSNNSMLFTQEENQDQLDEPTKRQTNYIKMGNVLHNLFSRIQTTADIPNVLRQLEFDGVLYDESITSAKLKSMLDKRLQDRRVADWFSPRWHVINECSIIMTDEQGKLTTKRPDRVMYDEKETVVVDFKFGSPRDEHWEQVAAYKNLLEQMGYQKVTGYIWYVYSNKVVEV